MDALIYIIPLIRNSHFPCGFGPTDVCNECAGKLAKATQWKGRAKLLVNFVLTLYYNSLKVVIWSYYSPNFLKLFLTCLDRKSVV